MGMDAAARLRVSYLAIIYTIIALFCLAFFFTYSTKHQQLGLYQSQRRLEVIV